MGDSSKERLVKSKMRWDVVFWVTITLIIMFSMLVIIQIFVYEPPNKITEKDLVCGNLSLIDTGYCLNDFVGEIFSFNRTKDSLVLSVSDLINRGGDCRNWNRDFYLRYMEGYGFETDIVSIPINKNTSHVISISYDETGYCVMDQKEIFCMRYKNEI